MFRTILKASVRHLVQINIPPKFLNPILEEKLVMEDKAYQDQLKQVLLPAGKKHSIEERT